MLVKNAFLAQIFQTIFQDRKTNQNVSEKTFFSLDPDLLFLWIWIRTSKKHADLCRSRLETLLFTLPLSEP